MCTPFYAMAQRFFWLFDASVHTEHTGVATIVPTTDDPLQQHFVVSAAG
jgi:hypothetical protein